MLLIYCLKFINPLSIIFKYLELQLKRCKPIKFIILLQDQLQFYRENMQMPLQTSFPNYQHFQTNQNDFFCEFIFVKKLQIQGKIEKLTLDVYLQMRLIQKLVGKNYKQRLQSCQQKHLSTPKLIVSLKPKLITYLCLKFDIIPSKNSTFNPQVYNKITNFYLFSTFKDSHTKHHQSCKMQAQKRHNQKQTKKELFSQEIAQNQQQQCTQRLDKQSDQQDMIGQFDPKLYEEFVIYERPNFSSEDQKSRCLKRKQKLQSLRNQLKDPESRKLRNRQRHQKQKNKLLKSLEGLSQQQIRKFLDQRKLKRNQLKNRVKNVIDEQIGLPFLIDMAYENTMNPKQNKSLAAQIQLIMKTFKKMEIPPSVHVCGVKQGQVKDQLIKMKYDHWPMKFYEEPIQQCIKMEKFKNKNVYYLSPDAKQTVQSINQNDIFIIGGLVDRTVIKDASLYRAMELGIQARSLPIRPFMKQRTCLNLDHIVSIMCKFVQVKDWKTAFQHGAPKRWRKGQGEKGLKLLVQNKSQEPSQKSEDQPNKEQPAERQITSNKAQRNQ